MAGRFATRTPNRHTAPLAKLLLGLCLLAAAGFLAVGATHSFAQDEIDTKSPLPAINPKGTGLPEKYAIPNKRAAIFAGRYDARTATRLPNTGIVDFEGLASEAKNSDEYQAWTAVVQHAKQFPATELDAVASRDLTRDDLTLVQAGSPRFPPYRLELFRFDGKLAKVRRVEATQAVKASGTAELYEALVIPVDEPMPPDTGKIPPYAIAFVFTELPDALAAVKQKAFGEWLTPDPAVWVTASGYFFKVRQDAPNLDAYPVLIGRSVTVLKGEPVANGPNPAAIDRNQRVYRLIKDNTFIAKIETNAEEVSAWSRVLLHARRFSIEDLERYADSSVLFHILFEDTRRDYKLELVKFEGRLIDLRKIPPGEKLLAAGVATAYEGWFIPRGEPSGNPISIVFTEPPEGVEATGRVNKWVSFAGYSFKLLHYRSGEREKDDPTRFVVKRAPLLLGRGIVSRPDPENQTVSWNDFVAGTVGIVVVVIGCAVAITWWFRKGDRQAKSEIEAHRNRNPFGEAAAQQ